MKAQGGFGGWAEDRFVLFMFEEGNFKYASTPQIQKSGHFRFSGSLQVSNHKT